MHIFPKFRVFWPGCPPGLHTQVGARSALESGAGGFAECKNKPIRPHLTVAEVMAMTEEDLRTECLRLEIPAGGLDKSAVQSLLFGHILDPPEVDVRL